MRGMAVEDDRNGQSHRPPAQNIFNVPPSSQQPPFSTYLQDFNGFYAPPPREHYIEFPFPYSGPPDPSLYSSPVLSHATPNNMFASILPQSIPTLPHQGMPLPPQALHPNPAIDMRTQPGFMFDPRSGGSQFFYPPQPILFPAPTHSPIITSVGPAIPIGMSDKTEAQFNMQSNTIPHTNMYRI
ncbi:hypothetical protein BDQ17DRAFT_363926 [Cyathus striatus]|nr:hypothetical protein BDQ17DRAFT_363926 [Cyathus striatus]